MSTSQRTAFITGYQRGHEDTVEGRGLIDPGAGWDEDEVLRDDCGTPPTLSALLDVLATVEDEALINIYDLDPDSDAPFDSALYAWRKVGCPR